MKRTWNIILPVLGAAFAAYWVAASAGKGAAAPPEKPPTSSDYVHTISGSGIIESSSRDIAVSPQIGGKVVHVFVKESQFVRKGEPLYQLDDADLRAQHAAAAADLSRAQAGVTTAEAQLASARASVASALANQKALEASLADLETQARANEELYKAGVIAYVAYNTSARTAETARDKVDQAKYQVEQARMQVRTAESQLAENSASVGSYRGHLERFAVEIKQFSVTAPMDGRVLQVNILPGEYVPPNPANAPILFGSTDTLQVRVSIDETNAPRVKSGSAAIAHLKGDSTETFPLTFLRIDPYIVPKRSLTGDNTERIDVRVLQVIYRFKPPPFPVYVGQQVDVFIAANQ
jgi:multidrug resistance efflux pump